MKKDRPVRNAFSIGQKNVIQKSIVDTERIISPPLHLKLGSPKNVIKAMKKDKPRFCDLKKILPGLSEAKLNEGVLNRP